MQNNPAAAAAASGSSLEVETPKEVETPTEEKGENPVVVETAVAISNQDEQKKQDFISVLFNEIRDPQDPKKPEDSEDPETSPVVVESRYRLKADPAVKFTETQVDAIYQVAQKFHYDGRLHDDVDDYLPYQEKPWYQLLIPSTQTLINNLATAALPYHVLYSLLLQTNPVTFAFEIDDTYNPVATLYSETFWAMGWIIPALLMMRCNHDYVGITAKLSDKELNDTIKQIKDKKRAFLEQLKVIPNISPRLAALIYSQLNKPQLGERILQDAGVWAAFFEQFAAEFAFFYTLLKKDSLYLVASFSLIAGLIPSIDQAYNQLAAIGLDHKEAMVYREFGLMPVCVYDYAPSFSRFVDFPLIAWFTAKLGPLVWTALNTMAARDFMHLSRLDTFDIPGGLSGLNGMVVLSALYYAMVFSVHNIDEQLAVTLKTKRDLFQYTEGTLLERVGKCAVGALSPAALLTALMHFIYAHSGSNQKTLSQEMLYFGLPAHVASTVVLLGASYKLPRVEKLYRQIFEMRFMEPAVVWLDGMHALDKALITVAGALGTIGGMCFNKPAIAAPSQIVLFVFGVSLLANYSRSAANDIRFLFAQSFMYAAMFLNWVMNTVLPFIALSQGRSAKDHPEHLTTDYFTVYGAWALRVFSLLVGCGAAIGDLNGMANKVKSLTCPIQSADTQTTQKVERVRLLSSDAAEATDTDIDGFDTASTVVVMPPRTSAEVITSRASFFVSTANKSRGLFNSCCAADEGGVRIDVFPDDVSDRDVGVLQ